MSISYLVPESCLSSPFLPFIRSHSMRELKLHWLLAPAASPHHMSSEEALRLRPSYGAMATKQTALCLSECLSALPFHALFEPKMDRIEDFRKEFKRYSLSSLNIFLYESSSIHKQKEIETKEKKRCSRPCRREPRSETSLHPLSAHADRLHRGQLHFGEGLQGKAELQSSLTASF